MKCKMLECYSLQFLLSKILFHGSVFWKLKNFLLKICFWRTLQSLWCHSTLVSPRMKVLNFWQAPNCSREMTSQQKNILANYMMHLQPENMDKTLWKHFQCHQEMTYHEQLNSCCNIHKPNWSLVFSIFSAL